MMSTLKSTLLCQVSVVNNCLLQRVGVARCFQNAPRRPMLMKFRNDLDRLPPGDRDLYLLWLCHGNATFDGGHYLAGGLFVALLAAVFLAMGATVLAVVLGSAGKPARDTSFREGIGVRAPIVALMGLVLMLGVYIPPPLASLLREAATFLEPAR